MTFEVQSAIAFLTLLPNPTKPIWIGSHYHFTYGLVISVWYMCPVSAIAYHIVSIAKEP
jgi:hypothetical protein